MAHSRKGMLAEALHDGTHPLYVTLPALILMQWIPMWLAFLLCVGVGGAVAEYAWGSYRTADSIKDFATYQLGWLVLLGLQGEWWGLGVSVLLAGSLLYGYYGRKYDAFI